MSDTKELLERARRQFPPSGDVMDALVRRRDRKRRNRRIGSAVVALVMVGAVAVALGEAFLAGQGKPAQKPTPSPSATVQGPSATGAVVVGLDGTVRAQVPNIPSYASSLVMAPDGRTIAFSTGNQIATIGIDGTGLRYVTTFPGGVEEGLAWSPDGSKIAFQSNDGLRSSEQIMVVDADGSHLTRLTFDDQQDEWPSWSPDGSTIAYANSGITRLDSSDNSPTEEIWTVPAGGGTPTRLTHNHTWDNSPAYSPDGSQIVFKHNKSIWIMDSDGGNAHPLPSQPGFRNFAPRWSPDGSRLVVLTFYAKRRATNGDALLTIHVVDLSTGTVTTIPGLVETVANAVAWLPSGDALLVNRYAG
jgi:Tol biopolymer transport system component